MSETKVVVVTPVFNRREETLQCLKSLKRSNLDNICVHVIVVDDGSTDGTSKAIDEHFPDCEIIKGNGSLWYTAGTNVGIEKALTYDPDYILAVNNDSIFDANCVSSLVKCAETHERSVVGALLLEWNIPHKVFQVAPRWETSSGGYRHYRKQTVWTVPTRPFEVELIVGNCVLYPASAVRDVGLMNAKKFPQYGDAEYTPRMRKRGWRLLVEPRARVFCKPNDLVTGFRQLPFWKKVSELFLRDTGPYSLKRRFNMTVYGGPSKLRGLLAFNIFFIRKVLGRNIEGDWGMQQNEQPLSIVLADSVVNDRNLTKLG